MNINWPQEEGEAYFSAFIRRPQHICLLAEADGETAGYLAGYLEQPDSLRPVKSAELDSMYVKEEHRDKGIGERLVQGFFTWCRDNGAAVVSVTFTLPTRERFTSTKGMVSNL
jgi:GNAT superfamily N-acetyltransferase